MYRNSFGVVVEDTNGIQEGFDQVILACNANHALTILDQPTRLERYILSSVRYDTELHHRAIVHSDASVLPGNEVRPLETRSNHIEQYGEKPDNYEITYLMHNQQPWAGRSDKPCLVTYNPVSPIGPSRSRVEGGRLFEVPDWHRGSGKPGLLSPGERQPLSGDRQSPSGPQL